MNSWLKQVGSGHEAKWVVSHEMASAEIAAHGAHVLSWQAAGKPEALYLSPLAIFAEGKAIRGGVPICWPWFGGEGQPAHGLVRTRLWDLEQAIELENGVKLVFRIEADDETKAIWPHDFLLRYEVFIGQRLEMSLLSSNRGRETWLESGAIHTYLAIDSLEHVRISGLDGAEYDEHADGKQGRFTQHGDVAFSGEMDRVYASAGCVELRDFSRAIRIEKQGSHATVVWNPAAEKAAKLVDLPDFDFEKFVCVEAVNLQQAQRFVAAGETARFSQSLSWIED